MSLKWCAVVVLLFLEQAHAQCANPVTTTGRQCFTNNVIGGGATQWAVSLSDAAYNIESRFLNALATTASPFGATCNNAVAKLICLTKYSQCSGQTAFRPCSDVCTNFLQACTGVGDYTNTWNAAIGNRNSNEVIWNDVFDAAQALCGRTISGTAAFPTTNCVQSDGNVRTTPVNPIEYTSGPAVASGTTTSLTVSASFNQAVSFACSARLAGEFTAQSATTIRTRGTASTVNCNGNSCQVTVRAVVNNQGQQTAFSVGQSYTLDCVATSGTTVSAVRTVTGTTSGLSTLTFVEAPAVFQTSISSIVVTARPNEAARIWCIARPRLGNGQFPAALGSSLFQVAADQQRIFTVNCGANILCDVVLHSLPDVGERNYIVDCAAQDSQLRTYSQQIRLEAVLASVRDNSALNFNSAPVISAVTPRSITVTARLNKNSRLYCVHNSNPNLWRGIGAFNDIPTLNDMRNRDAQFRDTIRTPCRANTPCDLRVGLLNPGVEYTVWCIGEDYSSNARTTNTMILTASTPGDETAPAWEEVPYQSDHTPSCATITARINELGVLYCAAVDANQFNLEQYVQQNANFPNTRTIGQRLLTLGGAAASCNPGMDCTVQLLSYAQFNNNNLVGRTFLSRGTRYIATCVATDVWDNVNAFYSFNIQTDASNDNTSPGFLVSPTVVSSTLSSVVVRAVMNEDGRMFCSYRGNVVNGNTVTASEVFNVAQQTNVNTVYSDCRSGTDCNVEVNEIPTNPNGQARVFCAIMDVSGNTNNQVAQAVGSTTAIPDRVAVSWDNENIVVNAWSRGFEVATRPGEPGMVWCVATVSAVNFIPTGPMDVVSRPGAVRADCDAVNVECRLVIDNLNAATDYDIFCANQDNNENWNRVVLSAASRTTSNNDDCGNAANSCNPVWVTRLNNVQNPAIGTVSYNTVTLTAQVTIPRTRNNGDRTSEVGNGMFGCVAVGPDTITAIDAINNNVNAPNALFVANNAAPSRCTSGTGNCVVTVQGLQEGTRYRFYCTLWDRNNNRPSVRSIEATTLVRTRSTLATYRREPVVRGTTENSISVWAVFNKDVTMRCIATIRTNNNPNPAPTATAVFNSAQASGNTCGDFQPCAVTVGNLNEAANYDVFCTAQDPTVNLGNQLLAVRSVVASTTARDTTVPQYRMVPTVFDRYKNEGRADIHPNMVEVRVAVDEPVRFGCAAIPTTNTQGFNYQPPTIARNVFNYVRPTPGIGINAAALPNHAVATTNCRASTALPSHGTTQSNINEGTDPTVCILSVTGLSPNNDYTLYCAAEDMSPQRNTRGSASNGIDQSQSISLVARTGNTNYVDVAPPRWGVVSGDSDIVLSTTVGAGIGANLVGGAVAATVRLSEAGSVRCVATESRHALRAPDIFQNTHQFSNINNNCAGNTDCRVVVGLLTNRLESNTFYEVQCAIRDAAGNINFATRRARIQTPNVNNVRCGDLEIQDGEACELGFQKPCVEVQPEMFNGGYAQCIGCKSFNTLGCTRRNVLRQTSGQKPRFQNI